MSSLRPSHTQGCLLSLCVLLIPPSVTRLEYKNSWKRLAIVFILLLFWVVSVGEFSFSKWPEARCLFHFSSPVFWSVYCTAVWRFSSDFHPAHLNCMLFVQQFPSAVWNITFMIRWHSRIYLTLYLTLRYQVKMSVMLPEMFEVPKFILLLNNYIYSL